MSFKEDFPAKAVFPVIHVRDFDQVARNIQRAISANADGVFVIDHSTSNPTFALVEIIHRLQWFDGYDDLWMGANFLQESLAGAAAWCDALNVRALWSDLSPILTPEYPLADELLRERIFTETLSRGFCSIFGALAFKGQPQPQDLAQAAKELTGRVDVITTSGSGTGSAAMVEKLATIREAVGENQPLATASGVTPANAAAQLEYVDAVLVATGIAPGDGQHDDFYEIDPAKLRELVAVARSFEPSD